nr:thiamine phosphate synthase [uncultured Anaeromusa sp.]
MAELICVTQRKLCPDDFLERVSRLAQAKLQAILLREKDLGEADYEELAREVQKRCIPWGVRLIVRRYAGVARRLGVRQLHLSMEELRQAEPGALAGLQVGVSVHSVAEAAEAEHLGTAYLIAGHIYATDCKKGLQPRGLDFLSEVCRTVKMPVYAIGGVTAERVSELLVCGAAGCCVMSGVMQCSAPEEYLTKVLAKLADENL